MSTQLELGIAQTAIDILKLWNELIVRSENEESPEWYKLDQRQAYHDALRRMQHYGLIYDFSCLHMWVTLPHDPSEKIYSAIKTEFVPTGPMVKI